MCVVTKKSTDKILGKLTYIKYERLYIYIYIIYVCIYTVHRRTDKLKLFTHAGYTRVALGVLVNVNFIVVQR